MGENWLLAFEYPSTEAAKSDCERVRDAILLGNLDASVYRSQINRRSHVVVVGNGSLDVMTRALYVGLCRVGEFTHIPDSVATFLVDRRNENRIPGVFWERRSFS